MKKICEQIDLTLLTDVKNKDFFSLSEDDTKLTIKHNELYFDKIDINKDFELFGLIFNNYEKISCNSYVKFNARIYKSTITEYKSICEIFNNLNLHSRNNEYSIMMLSEHWSDEDYISISYSEGIESELVHISYFKIIDKFMSKGKNAEEFQLVSSNEFVKQFIETISIDPTILPDNLFGDYDIKELLYHDMNYDNYNGILKFDNIIFNQKNSKYKASLFTKFKDGVLNCMNIYFSNFSQLELVELISRKINGKMSKIEINYNNDKYEHYCIIGSDSFIYIEKLFNREIDFNVVTIGRINDSNFHDFENKVKSLFDLY